jgi:hypothetical protein
LAETLIGNGLLHGRLLGRHFPKGGGTQADDHDDQEQEEQSEKEFSHRLNSRELSIDENLTVAQPPVSGRHLATVTLIYARFSLWRQCGTLSARPVQFNAADP